jgi:hypothetical protein
VLLGGSHARAEKCPTEKACQSFHLGHPPDFDFV